MFFKMIIIFIYTCIVFFSCLNCSKLILDYVTFNFSIEFRIEKKERETQRESEKEREREKPKKKTKKKKTNS